VRGLDGAAVAGARLKTKRVSSAAVSSLNRAPRLVVASRAYHCLASRTWSGVANLPANRTNESADDVLSKGHGPLMLRTTRALRLPRPPP
jgi:hypothetical protein